MTGIAIRIYRAGRWQAVDLDELTQRELRAHVAERPELAWVYVDLLCKWIREQAARPRLELVRSGAVPRGWIVLDHCRELARKLLGDYETVDFMFQEESLGDVLAIAATADVEVVFPPMPPLE